jgi:hypothetical protein
LFRRNRCAGPSVFRSTHQELSDFVSEIPDEMTGQKAWARLTVATMLQDRILTKSDHTGTKCVIRGASARRAMRPLSRCAIKDEHHSVGASAQQDRVQRFGYDRVDEIASALRRAPAGWARVHRWECRPSAGVDGPHGSNPSNFSNEDASILSKPGRCRVAMRPPDGGAARRLQSSRASPQIILRRSAGCPRGKDYDAQWPSIVPAFISEQKSACLDDRRAAAELCQLQQRARRRDSVTRTSRISHWQRRNIRQRETCEERSEP